MDEPNATDPGVEDAGDEAPAEGPDRRVEPDEPTLAPGDSDLADAWWAQ
jgi:hypothetical protein